MSIENVSPFIQELTWPDVREEVHRVNKPLAEIIDKLNPGKKFTLIKVKYSFGDLILNDGILQLPSEKSILLPFSDQSLDKKIQDKLNYNSIPLFLTLKNCNEVFIDTGNRIIPLNLFSQGSLLGAFESTDFILSQISQAKWSVSAGARSIFMLPKINERGGFKRLRTYFRLPSELKLQHLSDHWSVFKIIANHPTFTQPWQNEILLFSKEWLINKKDASWWELYEYILKQAWQQAQFAITKIEFGLLWETFVNVISARRLKPTPYLADHVKHIMLVAAGKWPGFRPVDSMQTIAPISDLQKAIIEIYSLKKYIPTIMHACPLNYYSNLPVYYSLAFPTLIEGSPLNKNSSTMMIDLREIKLLLELLVESLPMNKKFSSTPFNNAKFEYFHVEPDKQEEIQLSKNIIQADPLFLQEASDYPDRTFCSTSPFWRGCIKVSHSTS